MTWAGLCAGQRLCWSGASACSCGAPASARLLPAQVWRPDAQRLEWRTHESKATSGSEDRRGAQPPHTAGETPQGGKQHTGKHTRQQSQKTHNNTLVYCGRFPRAKKIDCIAQNTFHKTSSKHCKTPQNTAKQSQNAFCEITSQNTAKRKQNARKRHNTLTIQPQYVLRAFVFFSQNTLDLSRKQYA